jgi:hypothetical protein
MTQPYRWSNPHKYSWGRPGDGRKAGYGPLHTLRELADEVGATHMQLKALLMHNTEGKPEVIVRSASTNQNYYRRSDFLKWWKGLNT